MDTAPSLDMIKDWAQRHWPIEPVTVSPLSGDASVRRYYRIKGTDSSRLVLWGPDPRENMAWLLIGRQLWYHRAFVPRIYDYEIEKGLFLLEDLGDTRLYEFVHTDLPIQSFESIYQDALFKMALWHGACLSYIDQDWFYQTRSYDPNMVLNYEWPRFMEALIAIGFRQKCGQSLLAEVEKLAFIAATDYEPVLIHRDFQSRNIMVFEKNLYFIDWQGARIGPAEYDLASLLCDPYVDLPDSMISDLLLYYQRLLKINVHEYPRRLGLLGVIRLMQCQGTYVNLVKKGQSSYKVFLKPAAQHLMKLLDFLPSSSFPELLALLRDWSRAVENEEVCAL